MPSLKHDGRECDAECVTLDLVDLPPYSKSSSSAYICLLCINTHNTNLIFSAPTLSSSGFKEGIRFDISLSDSMR